MQLAESKLERSSDALPPLTPFMPLLLLLLLQFRLRHATLCIEDELQDETAAETAGSAAPQDAGCDAGVAFAAPAAAAVAVKEQRVADERRDDDEEATPLVLAAAGPPVPEDAWCSRPTLCTAMLGSEVDLSHRALELLAAPATARDSLWESADESGPRPAVEVDRNCEGGFRCSCDASAQPSRAPRSLEELPGLFKRLSFWMCGIWRSEHSCSAIPSPSRAAASGAAAP